MSNDEDGVFEQAFRDESRQNAGVSDELLEDTIASFNDELCIRHDTIPESDSEDEDGQIRSTVQRFRRGEGKLVKGQTFANKLEFVETVLDHALNYRRNIMQNRYDKIKIGYNCVGGNCQWRVYGVMKYNSVQWEIRVLVDNHTCVPNGQCELLKVPIITHLFLDKIREEPENYMPMKIQEVIRQKWGIIVSRPQCQQARNKALRIIEHEYDMQFRRIREYEAEIMETNPLSTVDIETHNNEQGLDVFNRLYICFDSLRKSWKGNCRPVIGVDGCFLKSKMKGQLLVAIGRDPNNQIYPIAWAVVPVENTSNWLWFVKKLKSDLDLQSGAGYVLISDRQKGLINAVEVELPNIEHRMCVRHIYANLKSKHGRKPEMKALIWRLAWSYNEAEYRVNMAKIMSYDLAIYQDVLKANPYTWCRACYNVGSNCEDVHNNFTESFNATILRARERPIVPMLELLARQAMVRIQTRYVTAIAYQGHCTPYAIEILAEEHPLAVECRVYRGTNNMHQVMALGISFQVNLQNWTCSCKKWDIRGIPCCHGYAVIMNRSLEVEGFVSHYYKTSTWRKLYEEGIIPCRGAPFWPVHEGADVHMPSSPPPQPGRKKKHKPQKRKKEVNESPTKKKQHVKVMHCSVCGSTNHNKRKHKTKVLSLPDPSSQPCAESQPSASQPSASQPSASQPCSSQPLLT